MMVTLRAQLQTPCGRRVGAAGFSRARKGRRVAPSAGTAAAVRQHIGLSVPDSCNIFRNNPGFQFQKMEAISRGGLHVGYVYLIDKFGPTADLNLKILDQVAACLNNIQGPWVLAGARSTESGHVL